jgi:hypothetical protein
MGNEIGTGPVGTGKGQKQAAGASLPGIETEVFHETLFRVSTNN